MGSGALACKAESICAFVPVAVSMLATWTRSDYFVILVPVTLHRDHDLTFQLPSWYLID